MSHYRPPYIDKQPIQDATTYRIIGAFFGVYRTLGWGFLESVYRRALAVGLRRAGAYVEQEVQLTVRYLGEVVGDFRADLLVDHEVIVEVKTVPLLARPHRAQLINYLKATRCERGLLLNFGPEPQFERLILTNDRKEPEPIPGRQGSSLGR